MSDSSLLPDDPTRRSALLTTCAVGAAGGAAVAWPFLKSLKPSERALAAGAPVEVDIGSLAPGELKRVEWRGKPVWVLRRTAAMLASLRGHDADLADPQSARSVQPAAARNETRSLQPDLLVAVGICTHLGCVPDFFPELKPEPFDPNWKGGFYCPCHKSRYDMAGRVFEGVPAPANLAVPKYHFVDDAHILIGVDPEGKA